ncbi:MAG: class I SAM-dependent methyltransferase [Desulfobaccales bacterium]
MMTNLDDSEILRLKDVYRNYLKNGVARTKWSKTNPGNQAMLSERNEKVLESLRDNGFFPLNTRKVLDLGCGNGEMLGVFKEWGALAANLYGVDILPERIGEAQQNFKDVHFQVGNGAHLPLPDDSFDLVVLFTVFTSILDNQLAGQMAQEVRRVLKTGGAVMWYDFRYNNPWNPHVRAMTSKMIHTFFPDFQQNLQEITLWPALARRLGRFTPFLYPLLVSIPGLKTHYLGLLIKS